MREQARLVTAAGASAPLEWWRTAVIYQVYPRSFSDASGDGIGDLPGITSRLGHLADLGVDAVWLSPFFVSPQADGGYDVADYCDVDPLFGTLADFDELLASAHGLGLRVIIDIVPNHCSIAHAWFQEALASEEGSTERSRFFFREGKGETGELPPNNWESVFGGPAWTRVTGPDGTPGQWYLHLFDSSQPDFDWSNPWVADRFDDVLRFWLDRGVDGFRIDVANGIGKAPGLPDHHVPEGLTTSEIMALEHPFWARDESHAVWRRWRSITDSYQGNRALVAEAWVNPATRLANWVRPAARHQAFNFEFLLTPWEADALREAINSSLAAFGAVGAPSTWVLSNHDTIRHASRLGLEQVPPHGVGIGPNSPEQPDAATGLSRARAASLLMLALPGVAYVYQGEELGLPEVTDLPDHVRQDPTFARTDGKQYGRDGCRVPLPWEADAQGFGFSPRGLAWLPQPDAWAELAADVQSGDPGSTLELYRRAIALRRSHALASATLEWNSSAPGVLETSIGPVRVVANISGPPVSIDADLLLVSSMPLAADAGGLTRVEQGTTAWLLG